VTLAYIRDTYGVRAKRGGRVQFDGSGANVAKVGTITGARGSHILIKMDGESRSASYHPTWQLTYLDDPVPAISPDPSARSRAHRSR